MSMHRSTKLLFVPVVSLAAATLPSPAEEPTMQPLAHKDYDIPTLVRDFSPKLNDENKKLVYQIASQSNTDLKGTLSFSRWPAMPLPERADPKTTTKIESRPDVYTYDSPAEGTIEWHVNFAHKDLFAFY